MSDSTPENGPLAIKVFLSHKYEAPRVNEYFFQLFSRTNVQFEVDKGKFSTSITRLERMIRDADGFLAIYPFDDDGTQDASHADLLLRSRYFRLELELAARSGKPALVLVDRRFRGIIDVPVAMSRGQFDVREIASSGAKPSSARFQKAFAQFCDRVSASSQYDLSTGSPVGEGAAVGLLLPTGAAGYGPEETEAISKAISRAHYSPAPLAWPPAITAGFLSQVQNFNWMLVDVGAESMSTGIVGFLHGAFIPAMRLMRVASQEERKPGLMPESSLYGGVEVGYWKDIARWWDGASLAAVLETRLTTLDAPTSRFGTLQEALEYFQGAAKRKERVFISYSGADEEDSRALRAAFVRRFQEVFDYRDGKSIRPGQPWIDEISKSLSKSPISVVLLSPNYVNSGNCMHELHDAVALRDGKQASLFPIKLRKDDRFEMPGPLSSTQYMRLYEYANAEKLVDELVADLSHLVGNSQKQ